MICGHNHWAQQFRYRDKLITYAGSVGLPCKGEHKAKYLTADDSRRTLGGEPEFTWRQASYDVGEFIHALFDVGFLQNGGPISWLMFDEALTQEDRVYPFFADPKNRCTPNTIEAWSDRCRTYLESIGRWSSVAAYL